MVTRLRWYADDTWRVVKFILVVCLAWLVIFWW